MICILFLGFLALWTTGAAASPKTEIHLSMSSPTQLEHAKEVLEVEAIVSKMAANDSVAALFSKWNFIQRMTAISLVCMGQSNKYHAQSCQSWIDAGLADDALVVRDHALRISLYIQSISEKNKKQIAADVIQDGRNYRHGKPLWIVSRAQNFLSRAGLTQSKSP